MTQVGVIMSTYNGEKYVSSQIKSILDQTHQDLILTVADDHSSDETLAIVAGMAVSDDRISYKKNSENSGVNRSFQTAIRSAPVSDFYCLSDQDDIWPSDRLQQFVRAARQNIPLHGAVSGPALYVCQFETFDDSNLGVPVSSADLLQLNRNDLDWKNLLLAGNLLYGCCFFFNHELRLLIEEIPEGRTTHDYWIALVAAYTGHIVVLPFTGTFYRQHTNNASYGAPSANWLVKLRRIRRSLKEDIRSRRDMMRLFTQLLSQHEGSLKNEEREKIGMAANAYRDGALQLLFFQIKQRAWRLNPLSNILRVLACMAEFAKIKL